MGRYLERWEVTEGDGRLIPVNLVHLMPTFFEYRDDREKYLLKIEEAHCAWPAKPCLMDPFNSIRR